MCWRRLSGRSIRGWRVPLENNEILLLISLNGCASEQRTGEELQKMMNRSSFCLNKFMRLNGNFHIGRMCPLREMPEAFQELEERRKKEFMVLQPESGRRRRRNIMEETASGWRMSRGLRLRCDRGMRRWRRKP